MTIKGNSEGALAERGAEEVHPAFYEASIINAFFFDQMLRHEGDYKVATDMTRIVSIENEWVPALKQLGLFNLFSISEWLKSEHHGRILLSLLYLRRYPEELTPEIKFAVKMPAIDRLKALIDATISHSRNTKSGGILVEPSVIAPAGHDGWITDNGIFYGNGTVLATIANVNQYQSAIDAGVSDIRDPRLHTAIADQRFITNMAAFGHLFSLFPPEEWLQNETREGRMMPALLLFQQFPERLGLTVAARLDERKNRLSKATRQLVEETLDAYTLTQIRKKQVGKVLQQEVKSYIDVLNAGNKKRLEQYWSGDENVTFTSSFAAETIRGKNNIVDVLAAGAYKLDLSPDPSHVNLDLSRGTANIVFSGHRNACGPELSRTKLRIFSQWRRSDCPSCTPVINRVTDNWKIGQWRVHSWVECADLTG